MAVIRGYIATSLDGYVADATGGVDWLEQFNSVDFGYAAFFAEIGTVVMGRTTYDQCIGFGPEWVYAGKRSLVVTSRPMAEQPAGVAPWTGGIVALIERLRGLEDGDAWIVGGAALQSAMIDHGGLDRLELFVMPVLLGGGVRLFHDRAWAQPLTLGEVQRFDNDVVRLDYRL